MIFGIFLCIYHSIDHVDTGFILFCIVWNIILSIVLLFLVRDYRKRKEQRNKNVFIIKKGNHFKGKIVSIYDNNIVTQKGVLHNVTAEIVYIRDGEDKKIIVDQLCINRKHLEKYRNKIVAIYIYNNMNYIDLLNALGG